MRTYVLAVLLAMPLIGVLVWLSGVRLPNKPAPATHARTSSGSPEPPPAPPISLPAPVPKEVVKPELSAVPGSGLPPMEAGASKPSVLRPEDQGVSMADRETAELVRILRTSDDKILLRKVAKTLGDRSLNEEDFLTEEQNEAIQEKVSAYLLMAKSDTANERVEAAQQIERLWHTAMPTLLKNVSNPEPAIAELSIKSLILMRNERIVTSLIEQLKLANEPRAKAMAVFSLRKMKEQRASLIANRACMNEARSTELYKTLVEPALQEFTAKPAQ